MSANRLLAVLIVLATLTFAIGVSIERSQESGESSAETSHVESAAETGVEGEAGDVAGESRSESGGETLLGINPESVPLLIVAIVVSLTLAAGVWLRPELQIVLIVVAGAMACFAALDVREFLHQVDASHAGLAVLVAVVAVLHTAAAVLAVRLARIPASPRPEQDSNLRPTP